MRKLKIKGVYRHYKGDLYIVEDINIIVKPLKKWWLIELYMVITSCGVDPTICLWMK